MDLATLPPWVRRALVGNWAGSAAVAGAAAGTALLVSLVLAILIRQPGMSVHDVLVATAGLASGAFGADVVVSGTGESGGVGAIPLTITLAVIAATVLTFRRVTATYTRGSDGILDAARAALIAAIVMMIVALALRAHVGAQTVHASALGAFFLTLIDVFLFLALAVLLRRDWLRSRIAQVVHDWVRAPVVGLVTMLYLLPIAGAVAALAMLLFGSGTGDYTSGIDASGWRGIVGGVIAYAANGGLWAITLGSCGKVGVFGLDDLKSILSALTSGSIPSGGRLTWFTGTFHEPGLWVCVVLAPLVLASGAYAVLRACGGPGPLGRGATPAARRPALRDLAVWVGSLLLAVPYAVRLANVHFHAGADDYGIHLSGGLGAFGLGATFLLFLYALIIAALLGLATGVLDGPAIRSATAAIGRQLQQRPGAPAGEKPSYPQQPYPQQPPAPYAPPPPAGPSGPPPGANPGAGVQPDDPSQA